MDGVEWLRRPNRGIRLTIRDVDCDGFGGGSYGFGREVCHCDACRQG